LIGSAGVDLHQADIDGAVTVMVAGGGVEAALPFGDGPEEDGRDRIALPGLLETEGLGGDGQEEEQEGREEFFHRRQPVKGVAGKIGVGGSGFGLNRLEKDRNSGIKGLSASKVLA
jgi:hypothetical protein